MEDAIENCVKAVDLGRSDIVRSVIEACNSEEVQENVSVDVESVLNTPATEYGTLLHYASKEGKADIVRYLLSVGADPGVHNKDGKTPLDMNDSSQVLDVYNHELIQAVASSDVGRVCQLLAAGVSVNLKDGPDSENTPLHWGATYGDRDTVECLCSRGAEVNATNIFGTTPLHDAVDRGDIAVVKELLKVGASASILVKPHSGKLVGMTALDLAQDSPEMLRVLENVSDNENQVPNGDVDGQVKQLENLRIDSQNSISSLPNGLPPTPSSAEIKSPKSLNWLSGDSHKLENKISPTVEEEEEKVTQSPTERKLSLIWPKPKHISLKSGAPFPAAGTFPVFLGCPTCPANLHKAVELWVQRLPLFQSLGQELHIEPVTDYNHYLDPHLECEINQALFTKPDSYRIVIFDYAIKVHASSVAGLHYGICTLAQLFAFFPGELPQLQIYDYPQIRDRGFLVDMSKGRIPTLESFKNLISLLSYLKINQIQLYFRFYIPDDPGVRWQFPYPSTVLFSLSQFCADQQIELIPVVDVRPKVSFENIDDLYPTFSSYVSCFTNASMISVGPRLSSFMIDVSEDGVLSIDDARRMLPIGPHQVLQICAFGFHESPELLSQFPMNTMLAEYGFQADYKFDKLGKMYSEAGIPFCAVSGTAAWNSLAGCPEAAVSNINSAVQCAVNHNATGVVTSHWSGVGHMTHHPISWPALITLSGLSWNPDIHLNFLHSHLAELMNQHIIVDYAGVTGQVIVELGRAETFLLRCARNQPGSDNSNLPAEKGSTLYQLLSNPDQVELEHLSGDQFQKAMRHIRKCQGELSKAQIQCPGADHILSELQLTADLMLTACRVGRALVNAGKKPASNSLGYAVANMGVSNLSPTTRTDLANRLLAQIETYRAIWLSRHLPQGLQDSLLVMSNILKQFVPEDQQQQIQAN